MRRICVRRQQINISQTVPALLQYVMAVLYMQCKSLPTLKPRPKHNLNCHKGIHYYFLCSFKATTHRCWNLLFSMSKLWVIPFIFIFYFYFFIFFYLAISWPVSFNCSSVFLGFVCPLQGQRFFFCVEN